jgi:hypothetical protein
MIELKGRPDMARTAAFAGLLTVLAVLLGVAARVWLHLVTPLPADHPLPWFLLGALEDFAAYALLAGGLSAFLPGRVARALLATLVVLLFSSELLFTQAVAYFGRAPRAEELSIAASLHFVAGSADAAAVLYLAIGVVILLFLEMIAAVLARRATRTVVTPARLVVAGLVALVISALPVPVGMAETARSPLATACTAVLESHRHAASLLDGPRLTHTGLAWAGLALPTPAPRRARSASAPRLPAGTKPNLVFILLEGVRSNELGAWGGPFPELSPTLDALAARGIRVARAYSPGTHTPEGELGLWYGLEAVPDTLILTDHPGLPLTGLPEILRAAGWRSLLWMHNGDQTFYQRERFYTPRLFRLIDGRDFPAADAVTNWGYSDRALARRGAEALSRLGEPFAAMLLTVSNHHPFQVPADAKTTFEPDLSRLAASAPSAQGVPSPGRYTVPMLQTIHYTDEAVGLFFELARKQPWFANTVFVISGDHGLPIMPLHGHPTPHEFLELRHRVPLIIYSPLLEGGRTVAGPASLYDVPATLLGLFGLSADGLPDNSVDLLDPEIDRGDRPVFAWDNDGSTVTVATPRFVYHGTLDTSSSPDRPDFRDELLVAASDRFGERNLLSEEPAVASALRAQAAEFLLTYRSH